jgi:hypothetical protein
VNEKAYSIGYNQSIGVGKRYPEAIQHNLLRPDHDMFSLQWMCKQLGSSNESVEVLVAWNLFVEIITDSTVISNGINSFLNKNLNIIDSEIVLQKTGTGSRKSFSRNFLIS